METDKAQKKKQLYTPPGDDEEESKFTDFEAGGGESLLSLVTPELVSLSKHWLAALKDYALLSLPAEFASQLPPEGGAFYNAETIDSARPIYRNAWYPIVHAAALWLNNGGFENVAEEREKVDVHGSTNLGLGAANASASKVPEEINADRFHLIQGIFGTCWFSQIACIWGFCLFLKKFMEHYRYKLMNIAITDIIAEH